MTARQGQSTRKIIHVDMDAFYASVEQRDNPELRGLPVVVAKRAPRAVVTAASYEARRFGINSAMPAMRAAKLCPHAVFIAPDFARYKAVSAQIHTILQRYTTIIEPLSLDEAYLDVTRPRVRLASITDMAHAIRQSIYTELGLTASAGIAPNKFLAKIASDWHKPNGQFVIKPHQVQAFLQNLDVGRIHGVGRVMRRRLAEQNIHTVGQLRTVDAQALARDFGRWGQRLAELARGIDERPVQPWRETAQISTEDTLQTDLPLNQLAPYIKQLARQTWQSYQRKTERIACTVVLKLKTADFQTLTRSHTPLSPPRSAAELAALACALCQRVQLPAQQRFRLVGVGLAGFVDYNQASQQQSLFQDSHPS